MTKNSFLFQVSFALLLSNSLWAEDCQIHPQQEACLHRDTRKRGGRLLLDTISDLSANFETFPQNVWIDESQTGVRWKIEDSNSPWELNNPAPKPLEGRNYMRVARGVTLSFGVAILRSQTFQIPPSSNDISISFDFWIRSKWPQFTNLEFYLNENGNERLLLSLSNYSDINNRNWITSPALPLRSQSLSSNLSLVFYAYCGRDVEDAVVIDNIRLTGFSLSTEPVPTTPPQTECPTRSTSSNQRAVTVENERSVKNERIVGGEETIPNEFPWMAHLNLTYWSGDISYCTGTLISNRWILTAAHCLYGVVNVTIDLGAHNVTSDSSIDQNRRRYISLSDSFFYFPTWWYGNVEDDISLIKLPEDVPLSQYIQPIRLPYFDDSDQVGDVIVMTGWGNYSFETDSGVSPVLRKVGTRVISHTSCQQQVGNQIFSNDKIICGDGSQGKRYCYGDDGGPMLHYRTGEQEWFIIGVACTGDLSTNCQSSGKPNIYVRVRHYFDWIYNHTGIEPLTRTTSSTTTKTTWISTTPSATTKEYSTTYGTTKDPNEINCP